MKIQLLGVAAFFASFFSLSATEQDDHDAFLKAEKQAWSGNYANYQSAMDALNHPLKPYVAMAYLKRHPSIKREPDITRFLKVYANTPLEWPVRKAWLEYLVKRKDAKRFLRDFTETNNTTLTCHYLRFSLATPTAAKLRAKEVFERTTALWLQGKSQPKACDPLFKRWQQAGYRTNKVIWQRITNAAQGGQVTLLPYLKTLLPRKDRYLVDLYKTVRQDPSASAGLYRYIKLTKRESEIAIYGIKRLIWRDPDLALKAWLKLERMFSYTQDAKDELAYRFALALASKGHKEAPFWLNKVPSDKQDANLMQWQMANLLKRQDWPGIAAFFTNKKGLNTGQQYWLAQAYKAQGKTELAQGMLSQLATERHYYGFLAAAELGLPPALNEKTLSVPEVILAKVENAPGFLRAKALYELKRYTQARREWNYLVNTSSDAEKLAASILAQDLEWYDSTIVTLAGMKAYDYVSLRFPMAFKGLMQRHASRAKVDNTWAYAIARRESSFAPDARSGAGARGLMQLLPSTARYINRGGVDKRALYKPATNIRLGTKYLAYLKRKNGGNELLATASYNAGHHRVAKWIPESPMAATLWIEQIPYRETREYVKSVYAYRQVYLSQMERESDLFKGLLAMEVGR